MARPNPTLSTILRVQRVLKTAEGPISRYVAHQRLKGSVNYPVLDAIVTFYARLHVLVDEGRGGKVLWVRNEHPAARSLFRASRRVP